MKEKVRIAKSKNSKEKKSDLPDINSVQLWDINSEREKQLGIVRWSRKYHYKLLYILEFLSKAFYICFKLLFCFIFGSHENSQESWQGVKTPTNFI